MNKTNLKSGDVVQIDPRNNRFPFCFMMVTDTKGDKVHGVIPKISGDGNSYCRFDITETTLIGMSKFDLREINE